MSYRLPYPKQKIKKVKICIDCGVNINAGAKRCPPCSEDIRQERARLH